MTLKKQFNSCNFRELIEVRFHGTDSVTQFQGKKMLHFQLLLSKQVYIGAQYRQTSVHKYRNKKVECPLYMLISARGATLKLKAVRPG